MKQTSNCFLLIWTFPAFAPLTLFPFFFFFKLHPDSLWAEEAAAVSGTEPATPSFASQPRKTTCCWYLPVSLTSSFSDVLTVWMLHFPRGGVTLDPRGFGPMSQSCSPFTLNLPPKPSCSLGAAVGTLCVSLYLLRQLARHFDLSETTTCNWPDHEFESCWGSRGDRALEQKNVQMSKTMW